MLILSRKLGESIVIDGRVSVSVVRMEKDVVKIGIDAPEKCPSTARNYMMKSPHLTPVLRLSTLIARNLLLKK